MTATSGEGVPLLEIGSDHLGASIVDCLAIYGKGCFAIRTAKGTAYVLFEQVGSSLDVTLLDNPEDPLPDGVFGMILAILSVGSAEEARYKND